MLGARRPDRRVVAGIAEAGFDAAQALFGGGDLAFGFPQVGCQPPPGGGILLTAVAARRLGRGGAPADRGRGGRSRGGGLARR